MFYNTSAIITLAASPLAPRSNFKKFKISVPLELPPLISNNYIKNKTTTGSVGIFPEEKNPIGSVFTEILWDRRMDGRTDRH